MDHKGWTPMGFFSGETLTLDKDQVLKLEKMFDRLQRTMESIGDRVSLIEERLALDNKQIKDISQVMVNNLYPGLEKMNQEIKDLQQGHNDLCAMQEQIVSMTHTAITAMNLKTAISK